MTVLCSSSTVILPSSSVKPSGSERKSPFLGFSLTAFSKPSVRVGIYANSKRGLQVKCEAEETTTKTSLVPANQRWMFDEEEANGPVTIIYLPLCLASLKLVCYKMSNFSSCSEIFMEFCGTFREFEV